MSRSFSILLLAVALVLGACTHRPAPAPRAQRPVILISIDGFRPDYLDRGIAPRLSELAAGGVRGEMRPSFPSKTFPNHYTLVTGLRPDRHGIVDNTMEDPGPPRRRFSLSARGEVGDAFWWNDGKPIWVSAEEAGIRTAPIFWPGSEAAVRGVRPTYWRAFNQAQPPFERVDGLLELLDLPQSERPRFLTLYFDEVDTYGHWEGPESPEVNEAVARTDAAVGRLLDGLEARGIEADLVVVADHGMAEVRAERVVVLEEIVAADVGKALATGAFLTFAPAGGRVAEAEAALLRPHDHMTCWPKSDIPARYHFGRHRRAPPIFCLMETGWEISTRSWVARRRPVGGNHGFDPFDPAMRAIFIAAGPSFLSGVRPPVFDNVDVYPLLAQLLGLAGEPGDGDLEELGVALRREQDR
jgi:predicted AlkP superfamily pyrophosphatase or phosphodiesterase